MRSSADTNGHDYVVRSDANEPSSAGKPNCNPPPAPLPVVSLSLLPPHTHAALALTFLELPRQVQRNRSEIGCDSLGCGHVCLLQFPITRSPLLFITSGNSTKLFWVWGGWSVCPAKRCVCQPTSLSRYGHVYPLQAPTTRSPMFIR